MNTETGGPQDRITLLNRSAVAKAFSLSPRTIARMESRGEIPASILVGRRARRWRLSDIESFLQKAGLSPTGGNDDK